MKITIISGGSRGDVQPYIALGKGLKEAGHVVQILASQNFQSMIADYGLTFVDTGGDVEKAAEQMKSLLEEGNLLKILTATGQGATQLAHQTAVSGLEVCPGSDLIIGGFGGFLAQSLAEKLNIPFLQTYLIPFSPTDEFPTVMMPIPKHRLTRWINQLSHRLAQQMVWQMFRSADNKARTEILKMPRSPFFGSFAALERQKRPILYGYSPQVIPTPADWDDSLHVTGYWFLKPHIGYEPPLELVNFLQAGPPPIYIGFGSMLTRNPEETAELVIEALTRTGQRGVLSSGWGGLKKENLPETIFMVGSVPHSWLFPQMLAVVHHGGAGTTGAGLSAGIPSIIVPFFGDQPFWGRTVFELGVGSKPIPRAHLSAERLAEAIQIAISDKAMQKKAALLGERIRAEDGVARAVAVINRLHLK